MFSISAARPPLLACAVALAAAMTLTACGGGSGGGAPSDTTANQTSQSSTSSSGSGSTTTSSGSKSSTSTSGTSTSPPQSPTGSNSGGTGQTVSLSWTIPNQRTDGSPLPVSQLAGYEIYYYANGSSSGSGQVININDPLVTTYTTQPLQPNTYNFAISAIDTSGLTSALSSPVTITIK